jgi:hypothetical protein
VGWTELWSTKILKNECTLWKQKSNTIKRRFKLDFVLWKLLKQSVSLRAFYGNKVKLYK